MALKDWKEVNENHWRKGRFHIALVYKSNYMFATGSGNYGVTFYGPTTYDGFRRGWVKKFKTKTEALKYAKAYMRTH